MKHVLRFLLPLAAIFAANHSRAQTPIVPKGWLTPEAMEAVQVPLQSQLDTGVAMVPTAWSMAQVKDAELFILYIAVCKTLPADGRESLRKEQEKWLKARAQGVAVADHGKNGHQADVFHSARVVRRASAWRLQTFRNLRKAPLPKKPCTASPNSCSPRTKNSSTSAGSACSPTRAASSSWAWSAFPSPPSPWPRAAASAS